MCWQVKELQGPSCKKQTNKKEKEKKEKQVRTHNCSCLPHVSVGGQETNSVAQANYFPATINSGGQYSGDDWLRCATVWQPGCPCFGCPDGEIGHDVISIGRAKIRSCGTLDQTRGITRSLLHPIKLYSALINVKNKTYSIAFVVTKSLQRTPFKDWQEATAN